MDGDEAELTGGATEAELAGDATGSGEASEAADSQGMEPETESEEPIITDKKDEFKSHDHTDLYTVRSLVVKRIEDLRFMV